MAVPSTAADLSTTAGSNSPAGSESIGTSLDDYLRAIQAIIKAENSKGSDIASASTIDVPSAGKYFVVTGTTGISAISDDWTGRTVYLKFSDAVTLTHSAGLILPTGANITTAAGDVLGFNNESTGVWRCTFYQPATGYQPKDATLTSLAGLTLSQGCLITATGADAASVLAKGTALQVLRMNAGATAIEWGAPSSSVFTASYDSGNQTITAAGALTLAHSLGAAPKIVQAFLKCTDAGGDIGYSQNDILCVNTAGNDAGSGSINSGVSIVIDSTNLNIRFGSATSLFQLTHKTTGALASMDNSKWVIVFRAYA